VLRDRLIYLLAQPNLNDQETAELETLLETILKEISNLNRDKSKTRRKKLNSKKTSGGRSKRGEEWSPKDDIALLIMADAHRSPKGRVPWLKIPKEDFTSCKKTVTAMQARLSFLTRACIAIYRMDLLALIDSEIAKEEYEGLSQEQKIARFWESYGKAILAEKREQHTERVRKARAKSKRPKAKAPKAKAKTKAKALPKPRARPRRPKPAPEVSGIGDIPMPILTFSTLTIFDQ
jgi:hypothetical protein